MTHACSLASRQDILWPRPSGNQWYAALRAFHHFSSSPLNGGPRRIAAIVDDDDDDIRRYRKRVPTLLD